jgi:hypothetical protein
MPGQDEEDREAYVVGLKEDLAFARGTNNSNSNSCNSNSSSSNGDSSNGNSSNGDSSNGDSNNGDSSNGDSSNGDSSNGNSSNGNSSSYPVLTFLGTGSSIPSKYRNVSCILVQIQVQSNTKTQMKRP